MIPVREMTLEEMAAELLAWERVAATRDFETTIMAHIRQQCEALSTRMMNCPADELAAVREAYKAMCALRAYPDLRMKTLREKIASHEDTKARRKNSESF